MSHFSTIKTRMVDKDVLLQALTDLGVPHEEGDLEVSGYEGHKTRCEIKIPTEEEGYEIGFRREGDAYEMVADWYGLGEFDRTGFLSALTQRYAYRAVRSQLGADFTVVEEKQEADNSIHVLLRRMA